MNTLDKLLNEERAGLIAKQASNLRGSQTLSQSPVSGRRAHHWHRVNLIFVLPLGAVVVLGLLLRGVPGIFLRHEFEGFGVAAGFLTYAVTFVWQAFRAMASETTKTEETNDARGCKLVEQGKNLPLRS